MHPPQPSYRELFFTKFFYLYPLILIFMHLFSFVKTYFYLHALILISENLFFFIITCKNLFSSMIIWKNLWEHIAICENLFLFMIICENVFEPFLSVWLLTKFITILYLHAHNINFNLHKRFLSVIIHDHTNNMLNFYNKSFKSWIKNS